MLDICYGPQKISPPLNQRGLSNYLLNGLDEGGIGLAITIMAVLVICLIGAIVTSYKRTFTFIAFFCCCESGQFNVSIEFRWTSLDADRFIFSWLYK